MEYNVAYIAHVAERKPDAAMTRAAPDAVPATAQVPKQRSPAKEVVSRLTNPQLFPRSHRSRFAAADRRRSDKTANGPAAPRRAAEAPVPVQAVLTHRVINSTATPRSTGSSGSQKEPNRSLSMSTMPARRVSPGKRPSLSPPQASHEPIHELFRDADGASVADEATVDDARHVNQQRYNTRVEQEQFLRQQRHSRWQPSPSLAAASQRLNQDVQPSEAERRAREEVARALGSIGPVTRPLRCAAYVALKTLTFCAQVPCGYLGILCSSSWTLVYLLSPHPSSQIAEHLSFSPLRSDLSSSPPRLRT